MTDKEAALQITRINIDKIVGALNQVKTRIEDYGSSNEILHDLKLLQHRIEILTFTLEKVNK